MKSPHYEGFFVGKRPSRHLLQNPGICFGHIQLIRLVCVKKAPSNSEGALALVADLLQRYINSDAIPCLPPVYQGRGANRLTTPAKPYPNSLQSPSLTSPRVAPPEQKPTRPHPKKILAKPCPRKTPQSRRLCGEEEAQRSGARKTRNAQRGGGYERSVVCSDEGALRRSPGARSAKGVTSQAQFAP